MNEQVKRVIFITTGAAAVATLTLAVAGAVRRACAPGVVTLPRTAEGKPNLSGIWQAVNTAHWDLLDHSALPGPVLELGARGGVPGGQGVVEGNQIPYQPWAEAKKKENFDNMLTADPEVKCYLPGVPRATYMPYPFEIVQTATQVAVAYEYADANRIIYMDKPDPGLFDSWMGYSRARWEGDTLVVDVTNFNDKSWFDRAGNFHSDALHVFERYTLLTADHISYEAVIEDSKVFTRPWKISMPLYRRLEKNVQLSEYACVEFVEPLLYRHLNKSGK